MLKPSIDDLLKITGSKFILTEIIAKRAIKLMNIKNEKEELENNDNIRKNEHFSDKKEIEIALEELYNKEINFSLPDKI